MRKGGALVDLAGLLLALVLEVVGAAAQWDPLETAAKNEQFLCKQISQNNEPKMMTKWQIEGLQRLLKRKKETNHGGKADFKAHTRSPSTWTPR